MSEQVGSIHFKADTTDLERAAKSLENLANAGPKVASSLKGVENSVGSAGKSLANIGNSASGLDRVGASSKKAADGLDGVSKNGKDAAKSVDGATSSLLSMNNAIASISVLAIGKQFIDAADSVTTLNNKLKLATGSVDAASSAYASLYDIAQRSRVSFTSLGETFASVTRASQPLGLSQERLLKVTESIGNAMTISGGSAESMNAALVQLGQGLSSGVLRGEELNSVMEQTPRLARALADGLGVTIGQLRSMGSEGELTAERVVKALESQSAVLKGEVAGSTITVGQAFVQMGNAATKAVGDLDQITGASAAVAGAVGGMTSAIDGLGSAAKNNEAVIKAVLGFGAVVVGAKAATVAIGGVTTAFVAARAATIGFTAALAANPLGAALITATALGVALYAASDSFDDASNSLGGIGSSAEESAKRIKELQEASDEAAKELANAEKQLASLDARGAKGSSNLMLREAYADAQRLVNKLREAKKERDDLLRVEQSNAPVVGDPYNDGSQYQAYKEQEKARAEAAKAFNEILERRSGISAQNKKDIESLNQAVQTGTITEAQYRAEIMLINNEVGKRAGLIKTVRDGSKAQESAYASLSKRVSEYVTQLKLEAAQGDKVTTAQKLQIDLDNLLIASKGKLSKAEASRLQSAINIAKAQEQETAAIKEAADAYEDALKSVQDLQKARATTLASLNQSIQKMEDEAKATLIAEQANVSLAYAMEQLAIARLQDALEAERQSDAGSQVVADLEREIAARQKLLGLMGKKETREANKKAQEQIAKDWDKTAEMVGDTLSDYIMGGGKDAATYLKRLFSTLVLQPVVKTIVSGVIGGGSAGTSGVVSGLTGSNLNFTGLGGNIGDFLSDTGIDAISNGYTGLGESLHNLGSTIKGVDSWLKEIPGMKGGLGSALGYAGALASLAQGNYGSAAGQAIGTLLLPGIGTMIGGALGSLLDGIGKGEHRTGSQYGIAYDGQVVNRRRDQTYTNAGQNYRNPNATGAALETGRAYWLEGADPSAADAGVAKAIEVTAAGIDGLFEALGSSARLAGFWAGFETSGKGRGGVMSGGMLADGTIFGESGQGDNYAGTLYEKFSSTSPDFEQALKDFELDLKQVTLQALQAADDLPASIAKMLEGVETELLAEDAVDALLVKIQSIAIGAATLSNALDMMDLATPAGNIIDFTAALFDLNGGLENTLAQLNSFYGAFYSEEERLKNATEQLNKALASINISIDPTMGEEAKKQYRDAVNAALAAGDAELYAALLNLSGAFADVANASADAAKEAAKIAEDARRAIEEANQARLDAAWTNYEAAVNRERDMLQERIDGVAESIATLSNLGNMLRSNAAALYDSVSSTAQMNSINGMLYIESALASARQGADLTGFAGLNDAVSAARGGVQSGVYATQFERERDALVLAGQLSELSELSDVQLSIEEKQLKSLTDQIELLDKNLEYWRAQLDGTAKLIDVNLSVEQALERLIAAMTVSEEISDVLVKDPSFSAGGGFVAGPGPSSAANSGTIGADGRYYRENTTLGWFTGTSNYSAVSDSEQKELENLADTLGVFTGTGNVQDALLAAKDAGASLSDVATVSNVSYLDLLEIAKQLGVPAFNVGTNYVKRDMLARIHEGEAIIPKAFNPWANGQGMSNNNAELIAEVRALRQEVSELRQAAQQTASNTSTVPRMSDQFDDVASNGFVRIRETTI